MRKNNCDCALGFGRLLKPIPLLGHNSGTDAFTITDVNDCYMILGSVLDERKRMMDERAARDDALIERGNWVGLQRAMEASKVIAQCP